MTELSGGSVPAGQRFPVQQNRIANPGSKINAADHSFLRKLILFYIVKQGKCYIPLGENRHREFLLKVVTYRQVLHKRDVGSLDNNPPGPVERCRKSDHNGIDGQSRRKRAQKIGQIGKNIAGANHGSGRKLLKFQDGTGLIDRADAQMRTADIQTEYNHNGSPPSSRDYYTTNKEPRRPFWATLTPCFSELFFFGLFGALMPREQAPERPHSPLR